MCYFEVVTSDVSQECGFGGEQFAQRLERGGSTGLGSTIHCEEVGGNGGAIKYFLDDVEAYVPSYASQDKNTTI